MYELIIANYINKLSKRDLKNFALNNQIFLNNEEIDYVYKILKTDYKSLLNDNYISLFQNAKDNLSDINYKKIYNLYNDYRSKFKNYLN